MSDTSSQKFLSLSSASYNGPTFAPAAGEDAGIQKEEAVDGLESDDFESMEEIVRAVTQTEEGSAAPEGDGLEPGDELDYGNVRKLIEQLSGGPVDDDDLKEAGLASALSESGQSSEASGNSSESASSYLWDADGEKEDGVIADSGAGEETDTAEEKKVRTESFKIMANVGNFGLFLVVALVFTYVIGGWCDKLFGTKPVLTVLWMAVGVVASFRELYRNVKAAQKLGEAKDKKQS